jgi:MFS family permease
MRGGAGISAVLLLAGYLAGWHWMSLVIMVALAIGALFGLRLSPLGAAYRFAKRALKLNIPVEPEEEPPPRFAQLVGTIFLGVATYGFYGAHSTALGSTFALIVAALQGLLATTGICVGCEVYNLGRRLSSSRTAA